MTFLLVYFKFIIMCLLKTWTMELFQLTTKREIDIFGVYENGYSFSKWRNLYLIKYILYKDVCKKNKKFYD